MTFDEALAIINRAASSPAPQPTKHKPEPATKPRAQQTASAVEAAGEFVPAGQLLALSELDSLVDKDWVQTATAYRPNWDAPANVTRKDPTLVYDVLTGELSCLLVIAVRDGPHLAWPSVALRYPRDVSVAAMDRATLALEKLACP